MGGFLRVMVGGLLRMTLELMVFTMRYLYLLLITLWLVPASASSTQLVAAKNWMHGAQNCKENKDPVIDVLAVSPDTYLLRQNKCINVDAPFIYVFFG